MGIGKQDKNMKASDESLERIVHKINEVEFEDSKKDIFDSIFKKNKGFGLVQLTEEFEVELSNETYRNIEKEVEIDDRAIKIENGTKIRMWIILSRHGVEANFHYNKKTDEGYHIYTLEGQIELETGKLRASLIT